MRGPDLVGYQPASVYWSQDGRRVYFRWKRAGEPRLKEMDWYVVGADGAGLHKLTDEEVRQAPPSNGELSKDKTLTVFAEDGDIFLYDHAKNARRQITSTTDVETNPHFTFDQKHIFFTRQNNLYVLPLEGGAGALEQLTDIRAGGGSGVDGATAARGGGSSSGGAGVQLSVSGPQRGGVASESQEVVKKEERNLLEAVRESAENREAQEAKRKKKEKRRPFQVPAGQFASSLLLSPDGAYIVATLSEQGSAKNTVVPNYVTESAYTEEIPGRTKVGDAQGRTRLAVIAVETGEVKWVEHGQRTAAVDVAPRVQTRTEANATEDSLRERGVETGQAQQGQQQTQQGQQQQTQTGAQQTETTKDARAVVASTERDVQLSQLQWSEDGKQVVLMARAADNKDRWVLLLDPATARTKTLARVHDDAWVDGPGAFTLGWLPDNRRIYFESERDGFAHLYTVAIDGGGEPVQLTSGKYEVSDVRLSRDKTKFYFTSSEGSFAERHLYSMATDGGARTRLTSMAGNNQVDISPDETKLAVVRSYSNRPPELYLEPNDPLRKKEVIFSTGDLKRLKQPFILQVTESPLPEFSSYKWIDPPIVEIKARDGQTIYARLYKPANFKRGGAAVLFVHGAGYLQNVHKWWSSYYREYMFQHLLMERGFLVLDIDYRGSAGYGRDWRTGIYEHMGGKDLDDHVDAVRYLVSEHAVDPKRVGLYGGSYGGFITLMAMFTQPDVFAAGAALRPVTDWAHYNHPYTANILNTPQADLAAYRRSSPIYFAGGLKGALLICHGMVDTNVHFQDTVRLVERLIELRKENWELAAYPVEDHTFDRADSWADEYKRILKLFTEQLHPDAGLPPAGRSGSLRKY